MKQRVVFLWLLGAGLVFRIFHIHTPKMINDVRNIINTVLRFANSLGRPSKRRNERLLRKTGQTLDSFTIREAVMADVPLLASLHVKTWNDTYGRRGPGLPIRQKQWNDLFTNGKKDWFVFVIERQGELIGFAKGQPYNHPHLPEFSGELKQIYLLRNYQRLGLGRKLVTHVVQRFLADGITSLVLFGVPQNPSGAFYEALGAERLHKKGEVFQGGYGWRDLKLFKKSHVLIGQ